MKRIDLKVDGMSCGHCVHAVTEALTALPGVVDHQGRELEKESKEILTAAAAHSPELKIAMETWKEIKFEFDTVDKLDVAHK